MKGLLTIFFLLGVSIAFGQTIEELQEQLKVAETSKEKMILNYKLGEAYLRKDTKKSIDYAKRAHQLAVQAKNQGMSAGSAYLIALGYERKKDTRNMEVWLKSTLKYAKAAGDSDMIIKSVDKRSKLATKKRNYRRAYEINQEAFTYFSKKGRSMSDLESKYDMQEAQLSRQQRELEKERDKLAFEVRNLSSERDQLSSDKVQLEARQKQLVSEKKKVEEAITEKEERLASIEEEKEQIEKDRKVKERRINVLTKDAIADSLALAEKVIQVQEAEMKAEQQKTLRNYTFIGGGFALFLALFAYSLYRSSRRAKKKLEEKNKVIEEERERSDELLLNILPSEIAHELKEYGKAKARKYDQVTVLFSDFINFTSISEKLSPEELVQELDKCFKAFDFIISQYSDIEKIKTIGDAYMCASGLRQKKSMPNSLLKAALEMQEFLKEQKKERMRLGKPHFEARIGIHTGPVVAGVVGVNKFAYDIWGDTVNIAARIESKSAEGRVNISESTYRLVKYNFDCEYRGKVEAKNKGLIDMYFVKGELAGVPA